MLKSFVHKLKEIGLFFILAVLSLQGYSQSSTRIDSLKNQIPSHKDTALIELLDEISWEYKYLDMDSAFNYAYQALALSEKINLRQAIANSYNTLGSNFEFIANYDSALYYHQKSLALKRDLNDLVGTANSLNNIGIIYDEKGQHQESLKNYFQALKIYETEEVPFEKVPMVLVNIGIVYKKIGNYKKVLEYYQQALDIYEAHDYQVGIVITKGNIGNTLLHLKRFKEAIEFSAEAKELYKQLHYMRYVPYMEVQIANAKDSLQEYEEAQELYKKAITSFSADNNSQELADARIGLANNYLINNLNHKAKNEIIKALSIIKDNGLKDFEIKALEVLHKANFRLCNYQDAYENSLQYIQKKNEVFKKDKVKSLYELEVKYQTEKTEKELLLAKTEKIETEFALSQSKNWIYFLIFCLIAAALLFVVFLQLRKRKAQEEQLEQKQKAFSAIVEAQEEERNKIARELHDGVVQQIGSIILRSRSVFAKNNFLKEPEAQEFLSSLENSNQDLRTLSHQMMPRALQDLGITAALDDLFEFSFSYSTIKYSFEHFNIEGRLAQKIEISLYRITQELINNILKHSQASEASFQLFKNDNSLIFIAEDNGLGLNSNKSKEGIGLLNIKSRLQLINGSFHLESLPNKQGTLATIKIPL